MEKHKLIQIDTKETIKINTHNRNWYKSLSMKMHENMKPTTENITYTKYVMFNA